MGEPADLDAFLAELRACTACADELPLGPRPLLQLSDTASILVAGQAPGTRAHASGIPFNDQSGQHLREWMGVSADEFYDPARVAIVPMALCYPGRRNGGDAPPRPECAVLWRERIMRHLGSVRLTLLVGSYAIDHVLGPGRMTERVRNFEQYLPRYFPLPHPSWRSRGWMAKNPWFAERVLPRLRQEVRALLEPR